MRSWLGRSDPDLLFGDDEVDASRTADRRHGQDLMSMDIEAGNSLIDQMSSEISFVDDHDGNL